MISIYKLDSKGKIRVYTTWTEGAVLVCSTGLLDGEKVEHRKTCKPKNVGKVNAITREEQAINEMNSKLTKKLNEGYSYCDEPSVEKLSLDTGRAPKPMLATTYTTVDWNDNVLASPKLDGMRCIAVIVDNTVQLYSREGKTLSFPHIENDLLVMFKDRTITLDGELYVHSEPIGWSEAFGFDNFYDGSTRFQCLMKACKKYTPNVTEQVQYWIYDSMSDKPMMDRYHDYGHALTHTLRPVQHVLLQSQDDMNNYLNQMLDDGYEGVMLRLGNKSYENKRSKTLLKVKKFQDAEFKVVDIIPSEGRDSWGIPVCVTDTGLRFNATYKGTIEEKEDLLLNKHQYIGRELTVKFFELSSNGIPRFPIALRFKDIL